MDGNCGHHEEKEGIGGYKLRNAQGQFVANSGPLRVCPEGGFSAGDALAELDKPVEVKPIMPRMDDGKPKDPDHHSNYQPRNSDGEWVDGKPGRPGAGMMAASANPAAEARPQRRRRNGGGGGSGRYTGGRLPEVVLGGRG